LHSKEGFKRLESTTPILGMLAVMCRFRMMRGGCEDFGDWKEDRRLKGVGHGVCSTSVDLKYFYSSEGEIDSL